MPAGSGGGTAGTGRWPRRLHLSFCLPSQSCCGRDYQGWISAPRQVAALVLGPPRSGKTRGPIIPNVAAWEGTVLVTSTRRDVLDATASWRAQKGTAWVFDPLVTVGRLPPGARRLVWSPLRGRHAWDVARQQGEALVVDTGRGVEEPTACRTGAGVWPPDLWSSSGATRGNSWHSAPLKPKPFEIAWHPQAPLDTVSKRSSKSMGGA
ncbi:MAG: type IV secretory system conjugative DNA transfer family protein [Candidatus Dormibacteria bacterium]